MIFRGPDSLVSRWSSACLQSLTLVALLLFSVVIDCVVCDRAEGASIDLRLEVAYDGASAVNGGTWTLFARSDEQGVFALDVPLAGINAAVTSLLPSGTVNGTDGAGFATFFSAPVAGGRRVFATQQYLPQNAAQQGVFYGVGTLTNGAPNAPSSPSGTNRLGPNLTSLANVSNVPWGNNDPDWATGFSVASGTFDAGSQPQFLGGLAPSGLLLNSVGSLTFPGDTTSAISFTTAVETNLAIGVSTGDYNGDLKVDAADYTLWRDTLNSTVTPGTGADGSGDGQINQADYQVWVDNYGLAASSSAAAQSVPEPASCLLFAFAVVGLPLVSSGRVPH